MGDLRVTTATGGDTVLAAATVDNFKASLRGTLLRPSDEGYSEARALWNAMIDRRPGLIVRCGGARRRPQRCRQRRV